MTKQPAKKSAAPAPPTAEDIAQAEAEKAIRKLVILFSGCRNALADITAKIAPVMAVTGEDADALFEMRGKLTAISNMNPEVLARSVATMDAVAIVLTDLRRGASLADVLECHVDVRLMRAVSDSKPAEAWAWMEVRKACTSKY